MPFLNELILCLSSLREDSSWACRELLNCTWTVSNVSLTSNIDFRFCFMYTLKTHTWCYSAVRVENDTEMNN